MIVVRFFLRFLIVPLALTVAALAAISVVCIAYWGQFAKVLAVDPRTSDDLILTMLLVAPAVAWLMGFAAVLMMLPALLGVLIAEAFAIRSWIFHILNGACSSWIGWVMMSDMRKEYSYAGDPIVVVGAGIAAGFVYWAIAGWNAGFWRPVFGPPSVAMPPAAAAPRPPTVQA
jgi:hypothetical protein